MYLDNDKKKIDLYKDTIDGFLKILSILDLLKENRDVLQSELLLYLANLEHIDDQNIRKLITHFQNAINMEEMDDGSFMIVPNAGVNKEYDDLHSKITQIEKVRKFLSYSFHLGIE